MSMPDLMRILAGKRGMRTPEGLQRIVRARTKHGLYSAESLQVGAMIRRLKAETKRWWN